MTAHRDMCDGGLSWHVRFERSQAARHGIGGAPVGRYRAELRCACQSVRHRAPASRERYADAERDATAMLAAAEANLFRAPRR